MQTHDQSCRLVSYEKNISALVKRGLLIRWRPYLLRALVNALWKNDTKINGLF